MRLICLLAVLLMLGGCGSDAQVAALKADPMGDWSGAGVRQVNEVVTEPGTTFGKPRYARVLRILEVQDGMDVASVLSEAREAAQAAGWSVTYQHAGGAFSAERPLTVEGEELRGTLSAGLQDAGSEAGAAEVFFALQAYPA
jgi:hypothetical protein